MEIIVDKNISKRKYAIITVFAIVLGILLIYAALEGIIKVNILKSYDIVSAEIIYSEMVNTTDSNYQLKIEYVYTVNDKEYESDDWLWWTISKSSKKVGNNINVYYNINNPSQSKVYHISYFLMIFGLSMIIFPILMLNKRLKER